MEEFARQCGELEQEEALGRRGLEGSQPLAFAEAKAAGLDYLREVAQRQRDAVEAAELERRQELDEKEQFEARRAIEDEAEVFFGGQRRAREERLELEEAEEAAREAVQAAELQELHELLRAAGEEWLERQKRQREAVEGDEVAARAQLEGDDEPAERKVIADALEHATNDDALRREEENTKQQQPQQEQQKATLVDSESPTKKKKMPQLTRRPITDTELRLRNLKRALGDSYADESRCYEVMLSESPGVRLTVARIGSEWRVDEGAELTCQPVTGHESQIVCLKVRPQDGFVHILPVSERANLALSTAINKDEDVKAAAAAKKSNEQAGGEEDALADISDLDEDEDDGDFKPAEEDSFVAAEDGDDDDFAVESADARPVPEILRLAKFNEADDAQQFELLLKEHVESGDAEAGGGAASGGGGGSSGACWIVPKAFRNHYLCAINSSQIKLFRPAAGGGDNASSLFSSTSSSASCDFSFISTAAADRLYNDDMAEEVLEERTQAIEVIIGDMAASSCFSILSDGAKWRGDATGALVVAAPSEAGEAAAAATPAPAEDAETAAGGGRRGRSRGGAAAAPPPPPPTKSFGERFIFSDAGDGLVQVSWWVDSNLVLTAPLDKGGAFTLQDEQSTHPHRRQFDLIPSAAGTFLLSPVSHPSLFIKLNTAVRNLVLTMDNSDVLCEFVLEPVEIQQSTGHMAPSRRMQRELKNKEREKAFAALLADDDGGEQRDPELVCFAIAPAASDAMRLNLFHETYMGAGFPVTPLDEEGTRIEFRALLRSGADGALDDETEAQVNPFQHFRLLPTGIGYFVVAPMSRDDEALGVTLRDADSGEMIEAASMMTASPSAGEDASPPPAAAGDGAASSPSTAAGDQSTTQNVISHWQFVPFQGPETEASAQFEVVFTDEVGPHEPFMLVSRAFPGFVLEAQLDSDGEVKLVGEAEASTFGQWKLVEDDVPEEDPAAAAAGEEEPAYEEEEEL